MCLSIIVTLSKTNIKIIQLLLPRRFENSACYLGVSKTMQGQKTYGAFVRSVKGSVVKDFALFLLGLDALDVGI